MGARDRRTFQLPDTSKLRAWMDISERFLQLALALALVLFAACCLRCRGVAA